MSLTSHLEKRYRRKWQPTPIFLPWKSHEQSSLVGYRPQGRKELDTTECVGDREKQWSLCFPIHFKLLQKSVNLPLLLPQSGYYISSVQFSLVQFSHSVVSDSSRPLGLQHTRPPCLSPTPSVYSNSCPSSRWCHPTISSLCRPLLLSPSIFPSIRVFSNESALCIRWPKDWSFSFSHQSFQWMLRTDFL